MHRLDSFVKLENALLYLPTCSALCHHSGKLKHVWHILDKVSFFNQFQADTFFNLLTENVSDTFSRTLEIMSETFLSKTLLKSCLTLFLKRKSSWNCVWHIFKFEFFGGILIFENAFFLQHSLPHTASTYSSLHSFETLCRAFLVSYLFFIFPKYSWKYVIYMPQ